jgi:large subunit ribosomal protein L29|tara:strand:+ start:876 stop:1079 length:204 start_codon:yes stop_codon:yes gene_type:complete
MNNNEINEMPPVELQAKGRELRAELFNLNLQKSIGTLEKPHRIGELRKDIARVETALSAKKKEAASA